jgi:hypothetical protein
MPESNTPAYLVYSKITAVKSFNNNCPRSLVTSPLKLTNRYRCNKAFSVTVEQNKLVRFSTKSSFLAVANVTKLFTNVSYDFS